MSYFPASTVEWAATRDLTTTSVRADLVTPAANEMGPVAFTEQRVHEAHYLRLRFRSC
jgi:hypothetical protein